MAFKKLYECEFCNSKVYSLTIPHEASCICQKSFELHCFKCNYFSYQKDFNSEIVITFCSHENNIENTEGNNTFSLCPLNGFEMESLLND